MGENENFIILVSSVLLALIIDVRFGLILSCIIFGIFLIFFINKKMQSEIRENYEPTYLGQPKRDAEVHYVKGQKPCFKSLDCYKLYTDPNRVAPRVVERDMLSKNNRLQGGQNPKTLIPPMVTRPAYDIEWRKNTMIVPNVINGETNEAIGKSGYMPAPGGDVTFSMIQPRRERTVIHKKLEKQKEDDNEIIENFEVDYKTATWDDRVLAPNGYDPEQFKMNRYPANLPRGYCGRQPELKAHNETLFTTPIQPGVYYTNQVAEPINSNIGISFQQQFLPRTYKKDNGNLDIVDHDPTFAPPMEDVIEYPEEPKPENVFDPRFNGYGTSYRNYVDPMTGQPRFPYDDINAIRMPNYVVRSKIDTHVFSDTYGPMQNGGLSLNDIRQKAQDVYLEDTTNFRDDIMSRLMRKRNAELWQIKQYPRTGAGRMLSGGAPLIKRS